MRRSRPSRSAPPPNRGPEACSAESLLRHWLDDVLAAYADLHGRKYTPKRIHRLRTASRRAEIVIDALGPLFSEPRSDRLRKRIRTIRRRAGAIRDADVTAQVLESLSAARRDPKSSAVFLKHLQKGRATAERKLRQLRRHLHPKELRQELDVLLRTPRSTPMLSSPAARQALRHAAARTRRRLSARPTSRESLHALRISLKRLRYTIELFLPWWPEIAAARLIAQTRRLSDTLGAVNDLAVLNDIVSDACASPHAKVSPRAIRLAARITRTYAARHRAAAGQAEHRTRAILEGVSSLAAAAHSTAAPSSRARR